jgi:hypothetical protein
MFPDRYFGPVETPPSPAAIRTLIDAVVLTTDVSVGYQTPPTSIEVPPAVYAFVPVPITLVDYAGANVKVDTPTLVVENGATASDTSTDVQATAEPTAEVRYFPIATVDVDVRNN